MEGSCHFQKKKSLELLRIPLFEDLLPFSIVKYCDLSVHPFDTFLTPKANVERRKRRSARPQIELNRNLCFIASYPVESVQTEHRSCQLQHGLIISNDIVSLKESQLETSLKKVLSTVQSRKRARKLSLSQLAH
jgi:hypothetical protein